MAEVKDSNPSRGASLTAQELANKTFPDYIKQTIELVIWKFTCPQSAGRGLYVHPEDIDRPLAKALRGHIVELLEEGAEVVDPAAFVDGYHQCLRDVQAKCKPSSRCSTQ
jgi:hypothetical protein